MGEAFTAVAEGPAAVWWNPGALSFSRSIAVSPFSRRQIAPDFVDDVRIYSAGGTAGFGSFGFGVHFSHLDYGNWFGNQDASEYTLHVGAGVGLGRFIWKHQDNFEWGIGGAFKYSSANFGELFPGSSEMAGTGWDLDAGSLVAYQFPIEITSGEGTDYVAVRGGVQWRSVLGRDFEFDAQEQRDPFKQSVAIGVATEFSLKEIAPSRHFLRAILSLEHEEFIGEFHRFHGIQRFGFEISLGLPINDPFLFLVPRVGYINDINTEVRDVSFGGGLGGDIQLGRRTIGARFDYARLAQSDDLSRESQYTLWVWTNY